MRLKRSVGLVFLLLALAATLPVFAYDFHHWRSDGQYIRNSSTGQQSSNQAFNLYEQFLDAGSSSMSLYWVGELQTNGGLYPAAPDDVFGQVPPTTAVADNRPQEPDVDWNSWLAFTGKTVVPPRPLFTPNVPQAWSPVVADLSDGQTLADHFLASISFEPPGTMAAPGSRDQILNVYYPETADGLPGNATSVTDRGTSKPYWFRGTRTSPGIRIRDLEPVRADSANPNNPAVGVVTHPPIFARVPTVYKGASGQVINERLPVVFLVVGTGEAGDFAKIICFALKKPSGMTGPDWAPETATTNGLNGFDLAQTPNITDYFNPNDASGGAVLWSYTVEQRPLGMPGPNPTPVAGISFADVGTANAPQPRLFITTADGQIICLNAQGADQQTFSEDGDARISAPNDAQASAPEPEWRTEIAFTQPTAPATPVVTGQADAPFFYYGMSPAVARVPLTNLFSSTGPAKDTVARAISQYEVSEWMLFVADAYGVFRAYDAPGDTQINASGAVTGRLPLPRWVNLPYTPPNPSTFRLDPQGAAERFITPPVVYQGATPLRTDTGSLLNGSSDVGFDDQVVFASERGRVYILDSIGEFSIGGGNNGQPTQTTRMRFQFPEDDTPPLPAATVEPRAWPRDVPDANRPFTAGAAENDQQLLERRKGYDLPYANIYSRSAMAVTLGANANPNGQNPNLEVGDDNLYVPYLWEVTATLPNGGAYTPPMGFRTFYEYVGSLKPYGFIQVSRPILKLTQARVTIAGTQYDIPLDRLRVGMVKDSGLPSTQVQDIIVSPGNNGPNPNFDPAAPAPEDTVYFVTTSWFDDATSQYVQLPLGTPVELIYDAPTSTTDSTAVSVTETLIYPSCYRQVQNDPADPSAIQIVRGRASLTDRNARLEQFRNVQNAGTVEVEHEEPARVDAALFAAGYRQPSLFASGSVGSAGNVLAPSWFRGRIIALTNTLRTQRVILGNFDPRLGTGASGSITTAFGPTARQNSYDPGVFFTPAGETEPFTEDQPLLSDIGSSVSIIDGWVYVTHRNGHTRAYANQGGGASGVINGNNPPLIELDRVQPPTTSGNLVRAPSRGLDANSGIHISFDRAITQDPTNTMLYADAGTNIDTPLLLEWGQTLWVVVDFGPAANLAEPNMVNAHTAGVDIDPEVLNVNNTVTAQLRSPNGAVQGPAGQVRGAPVRQVNGRVVAVVELFAGTPSITNPLTPGTPLLWEKDSAGFNGEVTYELQVVQQGLRWRWPDDPGDPTPNQPDPAKEHYWEVERAQGQNRFPTTAGQTAGVPNWKWDSEWAPLVSYNNPIMVGYDPNLARNDIEGILGPGGPLPSKTIGDVPSYATRNDPGRKNGDMYFTPSVDGARSGSIQPVVPTVGMGLVNQGGSLVGKQLLFGEHGKSTPVSTSAYPDLAKLRVGDRSHLGVAGRSLMLRVQAAPLTKMGVGALYGRQQGPNAGALANLPNAPEGSFEQNVNAWDDGPHGMYSSIAPSRLVVTKQGTNLDLTQTPIQVAGRIAPPSPGTPPLLPTFNKVDARNAMEQLSVQVDIPLYTADDVYATRWRTAGPRGANPLHVSQTDGSGERGSHFNPFFPGNAPNGEPGRPYRDRAERLSRPAGQGPDPVLTPTPEDPGPSSDDPNQHYDDRLRRVVIFNDANGNGVLDLAPTYREAYRTFAVQVAVKPEMKIEAQQQQIDFGNIWHGKKQPGMGPGAAEIQEWQQMQWLSRPASSPTDKAAAQFWRQYWRGFNLVNTGNVNLAYVKPEVAYQIPGNPPQLIGIPSEGNDPWKALRLINGMTGTPNPLVDPWQIFLRTSFDDQLLPDASAAYGTGGRGVWLQKAQPGAAQGGSVAYADPTPSANPAERDPTAGGQPRETFISLNVPTGTPLGNYAGSIRFYNDRTVAFEENPALPLGFLYAAPPGATQGSGALERASGTVPPGAAQGEPLEPVTDPPFRVKTKVIENLVHGRHQTVTAPEDPDRRFMPTAAPALAAANGNVQQLLLGYISNRRGQGGALGTPQPNVYDLYATALTLDTNRGLFPYDELPRERAPWAELGNPNSFGWTQITAMPQTGMQAQKPSMMHDPASGASVLAWTERTSRGQGTDQYRVLYALASSPSPIAIQPNGQPLEPGVPRSGVRIAPVTTPINGSNSVWMALYSLGQGLNRSISYTFTPNLGNGAAWVPERPLATPRGLASVTDPHAFVTQPLTRAPAPVADQPFPAENTALPEMLWMAFTGSHLQLARTDIYLSRYRVPSLLQAGARATPDLTGRVEDFARVGFPRTENDVLRGNKERTRYVSSGADFLVRPNSLVELKIGRPDRPPASQGSAATPFSLIGSQVGVENTNGEIAFPVLQATVNAAANPAALAQVRIYVDKNAGVFRLSHDARTIAGWLTGALPANAPDPVLTADFTAATVRITKGDVPANDAVVVPTLSQGNIPVMDASWYRQQIDGTKWTAGTPVAGIADRLWLFWRRSAGATSGGATCYFKTLRPGIRVRAGVIQGIQPSELQVSVNGSGTFPEEVNPQIGQLYFPRAYEGQQVDVSYRDPSGQQRVERHYVSWLDETGERPVPMDTSVNEGSLDGFVSYEDVGMTLLGQAANQPVRHVEKVWLFWSSTRGSGGDLMYATLAPRIGPDANVGNTATFFASSAARFAGQSPNAVRAAMATAAATERRKPYVIPPIYRRGPYVPVTGSAAGRRAGP